MEDEKSKALEERQSSPCALGLRLGLCTPGGKDWDRPLLISA